MTLRDTEEIDRPREKLRAMGSRSLTLSELIAVVIGRGTVGADAVVVGKAVGELLYAKGVTVNLEDLCAVPGMGPAKACQILAALELARRFPPPDLRHAVIHSAEDVLPFVTQYRYDQQENVVTVTLSGAHEVLSVRMITRGLVNQSQLHPREVFADAITDRAAAIILVHNHPSGNLSPSIQDQNITERMAEAGKILGIQVLDHLIIGPCEGYGRVFTSHTSES